MTDNEMGRYNFHMGVRYMDMFIDAADPCDIIEALRVLSEFFEYAEPDEFDDSSKAILASKAINVAYTACSGACDEHGLDLQDHIGELKYEIEHYWS